MVSPQSIYHLARPEFPHTAHTVVNVVDLSRSDEFVGDDFVANGWGLRLCKLVRNIHARSEVRAMKAHRVEEDRGAHGVHFSA